MKSPSPMARRVRMLREIAGLSQRRVSARAGLDPSHVRLLEGSGQRTAAQTIARVAEALGVRSEYLIDGTLPAFASDPDVDPARPSHASKACALIRSTYDASADPPRPTPPKKPRASKRPKAPGTVKTRTKLAPTDVAPARKPRPTKAAA